MVFIYKNWLVSIADEATSATALSPCQTILLELNASESVRDAFLELRYKIDTIEAFPIPLSLISRYIESGFQALQF